MNRLLYSWLLAMILVFIPFSVNAEQVRHFTAEQEKVLKEYKESELIALAVATCAGTYVQGNTAAEYSYLGEYGWKIYPYTIDNGSIEANFTMAYDQKSFEGKKIHVLAFRGSQTKKDWHTNLNTSQVLFGGTNPEEFGEFAAKEADGKTMPKVHAGFNEYVQTGFSLNPDVDNDGIKEDFVEILKNDPNTYWLITGHSLGGAAATIFAERLVSMGVPKEKIPVITFGAPAVGNAVFAEQFGDKINLLRVTTTLDPVPGSLQTFFGGFKQFGRVKKFDISPKYTDFQHPISFYFDMAIKNYYAATDEAIKHGLVAARPLQQLAGKEPLVAIFVGTKGKNKSDRFAPDLKRFITNEYQAALPRYIVIDKDLNVKIGEEEKFDQIKHLAAEAGADYILIAEIDKDRRGQSQQWYVVMNQAIFKSDGSMVVMNNFGRRVTFDQGIMQSALVDMEECRKEMKRVFPWMINEEMDTK